MTVRAISLGAGVQSTALVVLAAQRLIDFPIAIFANVGDDSEHPATLAYLADHLRPYCEREGIELVEVVKRRRTGQADTILTWLDRTERSIGIPVRMANGAPGNRSCTEQFKIGPVARELRRRGATRDDPATLALGISMDEFHRMRTDSRIPHQRNVYPLIERRMDRQDCVQVIARAGLPVPPKSSCVWCPFKTVDAFRKQARDEPELFEQSAQLEDMLNERRERLGKDRVYLTRLAIPLRDITGDHHQLDLLTDDATCDVGGYCHV